jgi:hypothetical protein
MAVITCDRCEKPIDIPNAAVGQKVKCPACGDVSVVRSLSNGPAAAVGIDRAAAAGYPPALGPEVDVMMVRPAMFRAKPFRFLLLAAVVLGGIGGGIFLAVTGAGLPLAIVCGAVAVLALIWLIAWKVRTLGDGLKITTKRTIDQHGLFSRDTSDVLHVDIKNIQIKQSFGERLLGIGQIALSSSAEHEEEILIRDVPNPEKVRQIIDLYRQL